MFEKLSLGSQKIEPEKQYSIPDFNVNDSRKIYYLGARAGFFEFFYSNKIRVRKYRSKNSHWHFWRIPTKGKVLPKAVQFPEFRKTKGGIDYEEGPKWIF